MSVQFQAALASPVDKSESMLREELRQAQQNLSSWQESWKQAKAACEAWKKEAEEVTTRAGRRIEEVRGAEGRREGEVLYHQLLQFSSVAGEAVARGTISVGRQCSPPPGTG